MKKKWTKRGLIKALRTIKEKQKERTPFPSFDHRFAENLLLAYIGSPAVTKAFDEIEKGYA